MRQRDDWPESVGPLPLSTAFPTTEPHVIVPQKICAMVTSFKPSDQRDGNASQHNGGSLPRNTLSRAGRLIINSMWPCSSLAMKGINGPLHT